MYKETVKFFIKKDSKDSRAAYPILKGGSEDNARDWAVSYKHDGITRQTERIPGTVVEVQNLFHKVEVISTESRSQGGKLFKCKLYYEKDSVEDYVILDLRTAALLSIIQKGEFLGKGLFKGTYAINSNSGTYYIYNLEDEESYFTKEYQEYVDKVNREQQGIVLKNTIGLPDIIPSHIYTKVSKGIIDKRRYLYVGRVDVKDSELQEIKSTHVYFEVDGFYNWFESHMIHGSVYYERAHLGDFFDSLSSNGFITPEHLTYLKRQGILVSTSNRFLEDVTEEEPIDLRKLIPTLGTYLKSRDIEVLSDVMRGVNHQHADAYTISRSSESFSKILKINNNCLYAENLILYPLRQLKLDNNVQYYVETVLADIEKINSIISNYLLKYDKYENYRLKVIFSDVDTRYGKHVKISKERLEKAVENHNHLATELKKYIH